MTINVDYEALLNDGNIARYKYVYSKSYIDAVYSNFLFLTNMSHLVLMTKLRFNETLH